MKKHKFSCERGGLTIRGNLFQPEGENLPIAILSHGFMANQSTMKGYAQAAAELGFAAFTYDFCGGCLWGRSDGKTTDMSVLTEVEDLKAVIAYASSLSFTDESRIVLIGALVAVGVGKMSFGGLGRNPFNPALVGRVFLLISFPAQMTSYVTPSGVDSLSGASIPVEISAEMSVDAVSGPTLLGYVKEALAGGQTTADLTDRLNSYGDMLLGFRSGSLGEIAALALLLGGIYLLCRRVITWHIPVAVLGSMAVFSGILWAADPLHYMNPLFHLLTGGALLGALFMATDYVTSPMTPRGMLIYGAGIGIITILIRVWGAYPEGMSFAILIMNAVVPLINKYVKPKRFGAAAVR